MTSRDALDKIKHIDIDGRYPYPNFLKDDDKYSEAIKVLEQSINENQKLLNDRKLLKRLLKSNKIEHNKLIDKVRELLEGLVIMSGRVIYDNKVLKELKEMVFLD